MRPKYTLLLVGMAAAVLLSSEIYNFIASLNQEDNPISHDELLALLEEQKAVMDESKQRVNNVQNSHLDQRDDSGSMVQTLPPDNAVIVTNALVDANNQFALRFYSAVSENKDENLFFSPTSIMAAFVIAYEGARGETAEEIQSVFSFSKDDNERRSDFESLYQNLNEKSDWYKLTMANALWTGRDFEPSPDYVDITRTHYDSHVQNVDFANDGADKVNQWAAQKTKNKIPDILPLGSTDEDTKMVITNAMYFYGKWASTFDSRQTSDEPFWVDGHTSVMVPMMKDVGSYGYAETDNLEILEKNYIGGKLSMLILLPKDRNGLESVEESLDLKKFYEIRSKISDTSLDVQIPKFAFDARYDLVEKMRILGVEHAFDERRADFGGITDAPRLYIHQAIHRTFVDVDERGTEAAAVTALTVRATGAQLALHEFVADHPFIFMIQEKNTGEILFMGRVSDPTA